MDLGTIGMKRTRLFPCVGPDRHLAEVDTASLSEDQCFTRAILDLGWRPLNFLQRVSGVWLNARKQISRLLLFHRLALEAELGLRFVRADFFWIEVHRQLAQLSKNPTVWIAALDAIPHIGNAPIRSSPNLVFAILVEEVFLDTHQAFFNFWAKRGQTETQSDRTAAHLNWIRKIIDQTALSDSEKIEVLSPLMLYQLEAYRKTEDMVKAEGLALDLLLRFPEVTAFQNALADVYSGQARGSWCDDESKATNSSDATTIARGIYRLKRLRQDYPHNIFLFKKTAELLHLRAKRLTEDGLLAEALADVEAALTYQPEFVEANTTRTELENEMQKMRVEMAAAEGEPSGLVKQEEGVRRQQVAKGFRLIDSYRQSDEARAVANDLPVACGRRVWEALDLGPLERFDLRPLALEDALQSIYHIAPMNSTGLRETWERVSCDNPYLAKLDATRLYDYLGSHLFNLNSQTLNEEDSKEAGKFESLGNGMQPDFTEISISDHSFSGRFPILYWIFSCQDWRLKLQCVTAMILVFFFAQYSFTEYHNQQARASAYERLQEGKRDRDFLQMVKAAESFLSHPIIGKDLRRPEVEGLYSEALVRWFNQEMPPPEQAKEHLGRYREVMGIAIGEELASHIPNGRRKTE
jgi:hypothetical protein